MRGSKIITSNGGSGDADGRRTHFNRGLNPHRILGTHLNDSFRGKITIETEMGLTEMVKWADAM